MALGALGALGAQGALRLLPIGDEDVRVARLLIHPVRREHDPASVGREHREAVETRVVGDALEPGPVDVDQVNLEVDEEIKEKGQDDNRPNRNCNQCDCQECEQKRYSIETEQTPFLPFFIDEIERIKDALPYQN